MSKKNRQPGQNQLNSHDPAGERESRVQDMAQRLLESGATLVLAATSRTPAHWIAMAFNHAEAFVAECESRDAKLKQAAETQVPGTPSEDDQSKSPDQTTGAQ